MFKSLLLAAVVLATSAAAGPAALFDCEGLCDTRYAACCNSKTINSAVCKTLTTCGVPFPSPPGLSGADGILCKANAELTCIASCAINLSVVVNPDGSKDLRCKN